MARYVLPVVGAAVGFVVGGPAGASLGWSLGALAGSIVDPQTLKGPSVGDIAQQTSQEGTPRPIVLGTSQPIGGNVIESGPPRIVKKKKRQGKGGPKVETEAVYRTYAIRICEGPISAVLRVWRNNILVYDSRVGGQVSSEDNAAFLENARFFLGDYTQLPSPDLEALHSTTTTPAYRGTAYMVMADEDLTDFRGAIPQYMFQVAGQADQIPVLSNEVLYPWLTGVDPSNPGNTHTYSVPSTGNHTLWASSGSYPFSLGGTYSSLSAALSALNSAMGGRGFNTCIGYGAYPTSSGTLRAWSALAESKPGPAVSGYEPASIRLIYAIGAAGVTLSQKHATDAGITALSYILSKDPTNQTIYMDRYFATSGGYGSYGNVWHGLTPEATSFSAPYQFAVSTGAGTKVPAYSVALIEVERAPGAPGTEYALLTGGSYKVLQQFSNSSPVVLPLNPCVVSGSVDDTQSAWEAAYAEAVAAGTMVAGLTYGVDYPKSQSWAYQASVENIGAPIPLDQVVTTICERVGVPSELIDVSLLEGDCYGITITNQYPAYTVLQSLGQVFMFDPCSKNGKIHFVPRGANSVATITEDELVDDEELNIEQILRQDSISVPRVMHLNYYDIEGGLATDKQSSERPGVRRSSGESSLQSAVIMDATQAAKVVQINHKVAIEELRGEIDFSLPDSYSWLTLSDILILQWHGYNRRLRIVDEQTNDGYQRYKAVHDRQSCYTSEIEGIPAAPQTPPPSRAVGPTTLAVLDIPLMKDADDALGLAYYVAVSGVSEAWNGAEVELSYDGGANYLSSDSISTTSVMGALSFSLPDHPQSYPDLLNTLSVAITTPNGELEDSDFTATLNRQNLAAIGDEVNGWELIQFAEANETSPGNWQLSGLLRGRRGTASREHLSGEKFVLLDRETLGVVAADLPDYLRTLTFRATSFGRSTETGVTVSLTFNGLVQKEREVSYLQGASDGSTLSLSWKGTGRLGAGASASHGRFFESYVVTVYSNNAPLETLTLANTFSLDISSYTGRIFASVQQKNKFTGAGPAAWWPYNPNEGGGTAYMSLLGQNHPFDSGTLQGRMFWPSASPPFYVDFHNRGTTLAFIKYPEGASSLEDQLGGSFAGDVVSGYVQHPFLEGVFYECMNFNFTLGTLRRIDVTNMIPADIISNVTTAYTGQNYYDVAFLDGQLYATKSDVSGVRLQNLNETSLATLVDSVIDGGGFNSARFALNTDDVWLVGPGDSDHGRLTKVNKTDGTLLLDYEIRRFPFGAVIYAGHAYVYCLNNGVDSPTGLGIFKYSLADGSQVDYWLIPGEAASVYLSGVSVWYDQFKMAIGMNDGTVFDLLTETFV